MTAGVPLYKAHKKRLEQPKKKKKPATAVGKRKQGNPKKRAKAAEQAKFQKQATKTVKDRIKKVKAKMGKKK